MTDLLAQRINAFRALMLESSHVITLCNWTRELLLRNGVPAHKVTMSRHGLGTDCGASATPRRSQLTNVLRLAFLGRLDPEKGLHLVIAAFRQAPTLPATLDVYGVIQTTDSRQYVQALAKTVAGDSRITFHQSIPPNEVISRLSGYDALVAPSLWLETGPLVVLEAFAAGLPVIGSRLGGLAELITDGVDGCLVEPDVVKWRRALENLASDPGVLVRLRNGVRPPRRIGAVADDAAAVYRSILGHAA